MMQFSTCTFKFVAVKYTSLLLMKVKLNPEIRDNIDKSDILGVNLIYKNLIKITHTQVRSSRASNQVGGQNSLISQK